MNILGTLGKILSFPVTGPVAGLLGIMKVIQERAEEAQQKMTPKARLMELESKLAVGEISPQEYEEQEALIFEEIEQELNANEESHADQETSANEESNADQESSANQESNVSKNAELREQGDSSSDS